jgi:hypothetical protein
MSDGALARPPRHILLCCSGLGMGNASRISALLERQPSVPGISGARVTVASWGNGETFLRKFLAKTGLKARLISLATYAPPKRLPKALIPLFFLFPYCRNTWALFQLARKERPDLVVLDSDYHFLPFLLLRIPVFFLAQTKFVLDSRRKMSLPLTWKQAIVFFFREQADFWVQHLFSEKVLVVSLGGIEKAEARKVAFVSLVARAEFTREGKPSAEARDGAHEFGIILSGSGLESGPIERFARKHGLPILRQVPIGRAHLDSFRYFFIQGGFSSISEMLAAGKRFVVVPMKDHPEQIISAHVVERMRFALRLDPEALEEAKMDEIKARLENLCPVCDPPKKDGAVEVLRLLSERIG